MVNGEACMLQAGRCSRTIEGEGERRGRAREREEKVFTEELMSSELPMPAMISSSFRGGVA